MKYVLPKLPYAYDALEPYIDARTMEIHHTKHHQKYIDNLNEALASAGAAAAKPLEELLGSLDTLPEAIRTKVRNNGGGHLNHSLFWAIMKPDGGGEPKGAIAEAIKKEFESFAAFKEKFTDTAKNIFGSGWAWLGCDDTGKVHLHGLPNQDSPLMHGHRPLLGLDVWEHAYYLKYQNKRPDYVDAWWNVVNWEQVEENYGSTRK